MARADTLLKEYRQRRDFSRTPEPQHRPLKDKTGGLGFVVQKHDATRLHYDFRLEWEGVLKSWAVTKGPSTDPSEKRLAVRTEDHPLAYGGFEGVIPQDQYGGGTVMLWDRGTWQPEGDPAKGLKAGKLTFELSGERLKGRWSLVRMPPRKGEKRENWLLIKSRDEHADEKHDLLARHSRSIETGRTMGKIASEGRELSQADLSDTKPRSAAPGKPSGRRGKPAKPRGQAAFPDWREPQLATLVDEAPEGENWLVEMKYDGYRALIAIAGGAARIYTRGGKDWTDRFPQIAEAAAALDLKSALLDGEIVAFDDRGRTDFSSLQHALSHGGNMACFVFDLLELDGTDWSRKPLRERKQRLSEIVEAGRDAPLVLSEHVEGRAVDVLERLCEASYEGVIAKRADRPYVSGRGRDWLKVKCTRRQEFVIGGYSPSDKKRRPFSSILLGYHGEDGRLIYAGRVGTGFDEATLADLARRFSKLERRTSPFAGLPRGIARGTRFVTPKLVAEIDFTEMTTDGAVRHGVFKGLREDKKAGEVVRETPKDQAMDTQTTGAFAGVRLTNPDKVLFKGQGVTKADLAGYYERVADRILPQLAKRLLSLVRCPEGQGEACFFQKHESKGLPEAIRKIEIEESGGKKADYLYVDDLAGLISGVQMGTLEFHIWGSRIDRLEQPDRLVFDLDPDEGLAFAEIRRAAEEMRDRLAALGLKSLPLLTGGKGIHVVAPLIRRAVWPEVKQFTRDFARRVAEDDPKRYVATASKAKRKGRIFIDYLRNERGSTAIAPYSTRARKGCPIATPIGWDELAGIDRANRFSIADIASRLDEPDPWEEAGKWRQSITKSMLDKVG